MKYLHKDRYSIIALAGIAAVIMALKFGAKDIKGIAPISIVFVLFIQVLLSRPKIRNKEKLKNKSFQILTENGCEFRQPISFNEIDSIDGIRIDNIRYKLADGGDYFIDKNNEIKPAGLGTTFVAWLRSGGTKEPKKIQNEKCWK